MHRDYIDHETLEELGDLKVSAEVLASGMLEGLHRSETRGGSIEFSDYRQYQPGDDIRHIDWKLFGRRDEYYIKRFESQTELSAYFIVDTSESMSYQGKSALCSKSRYVSYIVATLTYLFLRQGDRVGLGSFSTHEDVTFIPASSSWSQLERICGFFDSNSPAGRTEITDALSTVGERINSDSMVLLMSDLLGVDSETYRLLGTMRNRGADISVFHPLDPDELELPFEGRTRFEPLEKEDKLDLDATSIRPGYRKKLEGFIEHNRSKFRQLGIEYKWFSTDEPVDSICRTFLEARG